VEMSDDIDKMLRVILHSYEEMQPGVYLETAEKQ